ncbi:hypothetical protein SCB49_14590 [unidentified eubacterium SCB49]|nr:hypothetical protein SCB49_14590 [unidentified eubacterium SCB49]
MKTATLAEIKKECKHRSPEEILALCLRLGRFKKENKELLTYLLFEAENEALYRESIKELIDDGFNAITATRAYIIKKNIRKILKETKKYIRYSGNKETEVELLLYFCTVLKNYKSHVKRNSVIRNIFERQLEYISRKIPALHEDLQYDFTLELEALEGH